MAVSLDHGIHCATVLVRSHVGSHALNRDSSRSHSIMTVYVEERTRDQEHGNGVLSSAVGSSVVCTELMPCCCVVACAVYVKHGKISFVDLAGSENLKQSKSKGACVSCGLCETFVTFLGLHRGEQEGNSQH